MFERGEVRSSIKRREVPTPISQTVPDKNPRSSLRGEPHTRNSRRGNKTVC